MSDWSGCCSSDDDYKYSFEEWITVCQTDEYCLLVRDGNYDEVKKVLLDNKIEKIQKIVYATIYYGDLQMLDLYKSAELKKHVSLCDAAIIAYITHGEDFTIQLMKLEPMVKINCQFITYACETNNFDMIKFATGNNSNKNVIIAILDRCIRSEDYKTINNLLSCIDLKKYSSELIQNLDYYTLDKALILHDIGVNILVQDAMLYACVNFKHPEILEYLIQNGLRPDKGALDNVIKGLPRSEKLLDVFLQNNIDFTEMTNNIEHSYWTKLEDCGVNMKWVAENLSKPNSHAYSRVYDSSDDDW